MKIRMGFVSNSSSSSFVVEVTAREWKDGHFTGAKIVLSKQQIDLLLEKGWQIYDDIGDPFKELCQYLQEMPSILDNLPVTSFNLCFRKKFNVNEDPRDYLIEEKIAYQCEEGYGTTLQVWDGTSDYATNYRQRGTEYLMGYDNPNPYNRDYWDKNGEHKVLLHLLMRQHV
jgi:hypothetical protein